MSLNPELHRLLIAKQSLAELKRKREKAWRKSIWNQEDFDYAKRSAFYLYCGFNGVLTGDDQSPLSRNGHLVKPLLD